MYGSGEGQERQLTGAEWADQISELEQRVDLSATAREHAALLRHRQVRSADDLLRMALLYAVCDWPLRQVAVWCEITGTASLSSTAVLKRLQHCADWLGHLLGQLLGGVCAGSEHVRVSLVDTTNISCPGSRKSDWRVHTSWDLETMSVTDVAVAAVGGPDDQETLARFAPREDEIVMADRGYAYGASLVPLLEAEHTFIVRCNWHSVRLEHQDGRLVDVPALLKPLAPRQVCERPVWLCHQGRRYPVRLAIGALPQEAADRARQRLRKARRKKGRTPSEVALLTAGYALLLTNLPLVAWPAARLLHMYRWRWHIEVHFKRLKSVLHLDRIRARDPQLARTYLLAKLLAAAFVDATLCQCQCDFPSWFTDGTHPASVWCMTQLIYTGIQSMLIGPLTLPQILAAIPALQRHLCASPRRRPTLLLRARDRLACLCPPSATWCPLS